MPPRQTSFFSGLHSLFLPTVCQTQRVCTLSFIVLDEAHTGSSTSEVVKGWMNSGGKKGQKKRKAASEDLFF